MNGKPLDAKHAAITLRTESAPARHDPSPRFGRGRPASGRRARTVLVAGTLCCLSWTCCCWAAEAVSAEQPSGAEALLKRLDEAFRRNEWVYVPVSKRLDQPHLRGYDPAKAPVFRWPPGVIEAFNRIEAEKAKKRKQQKEKGVKK